MLPHCVRVKGLDNKINRWNKSLRGQVYPIRKSASLNSILRSNGGIYLFYVHNDGKINLSKKLSWSHVFFLQRTCRYFLLFCWFTTVAHRLNRCIKIAPEAGLSRHSSTLWSERLSATTLINWKSLVVVPMNASWEVSAFQRLSTLSFQGALS